MQELKVFREVFLGLSLGSDAPHPHTQTTQTRSPKPISLRPEPYLDPKEPTFLEFLFYDLFM